MAKVRQTVKVSSRTKTRVKKNGSPNSSGYMQCHICHGTGVVKVGKRKRT